MEIKIVSNLLKANETIAQQNRRLFDQHKIKVLNIMSSPGAGKTTLLEKTVAALVDKYRLAVIEGDIASDEDSRRLSHFPIQVAQINTINMGGACHLDASMINSALALLNLAEVDLLFVENVGNLICPSEFNLGEDYRVVILSIPEGDDKPIKYPVMFSKADALVLSKIDLLQHTNFNRQRFYDSIKKLNNRTGIFELSALTGEGMEPWLAWVKKISSESTPA